MVPYPQVDRELGELIMEFGPPAGIVPGPGSLLIEKRIPDAALRLSYVTESTQHRYGTRTDLAIHTAATRP